MRGGGSGESQNPDGSQDFTISFDAEESSGGEGGDRSKDQADDLALPLDPSYLRACEEELLDLVARLGAEREEAELQFAAQHVADTNARRDRAAQQAEARVASMARMQEVLAARAEKRENGAGNLAANLASIAVAAFGEEAVNRPSTTSTTNNGSSGSGSSGNAAAAVTNASSANNNSNAKSSTPRKAADRPAAMPGAAAAKSASGQQTARAPSVTRMNAANPVTKSTSMPKKKDSPAPAAASTNSVGSRAASTPTPPHSPLSASPLLQSPTTSRPQTGNTSTGPLSLATTNGDIRGIANRTPSRTTTTSPRQPLLQTSEGQRLQKLYEQAAEAVARDPKNITALEAKAMAEMMLRRYHAAASSFLSLLSSSTSATLTSSVDSSSTLLRRGFDLALEGLAALRERLTDLLSRHSSPEDERRHLRGRLRENDAALRELYATYATGEGDTPTALDNNNNNTIMMFRQLWYCARDCHLVCASMPLAELCRVACNALLRASGTASADPNNPGHTIGFYEFAEVVVRAAWLASQKDGSSQARASSNSAAPPSVAERYAHAVAAALATRKAGGADKLDRIMSSTAAARQENLPPNSGTAPSAPPPPSPSKAKRGKADKSASMWGRANPEALAGGVEGAFAMNFNELLGMMEKAKLFSPQLNPRKVQVFVQAVTRCEELMPQVHPNNSKALLVLEEFMEVLMRFAHAEASIIDLPASINKAGFKEAIWIQFEAWLDQRFYPTVSRVMPGRL
eukprot:jgi/Chlat1/728/Chrsp104S01211